MCNCLSNIVCVGHTENANVNGRSFDGQIILHHSVDVPAHPVLRVCWGCTIRLREMGRQCGPVCLSQWTLCHSHVQFCIQIDILKKIHICWNNNERFSIDFFSLIIKFFHHFKFFESTIIFLHIFPYFFIFFHIFLIFVNIFFILFHIFFILFHIVSCIVLYCLVFLFVCLPYCILISFYS